MNARNLYSQAVACILSKNCGNTIKYRSITTNCQYIGIITFLHTSRHVIFSYFELENSSNSTNYLTNKNAFQ